jgi:hypothetical protein
LFSLYLSRMKPLDFSADVAQKPASELLRLTKGLKADENLYRKTGGDREEMDPDRR